MSKETLKTGIWEIMDGADIVVCWLDHEGFNSQRHSPRSTGNGIIAHQVETIQYADLIEKCEGQLPLLKV